VLIPVAVLEFVLRPELAWRWVGVVVAVGLVPTLLWRRTRPLLRVAIAFGSCGLVGALTDGKTPALVTLLYVALLPYALFRWGSGREAVIGSAIMLVKIFLPPVLDQGRLAEAAAGLAALFAAAAAGTALRYWARVRTRELDQVKLLERERLARELNDSVGHHVSAMAIRAQAGLATSASHPDAATDALRVIEAEASRTLTEMRAIIRVLRRDQPSDLPPRTGTAQ
jgi:signal transduction histidine kinase